VGEDHLDQTQKSFSIQHSPGITPPNGDIFITSFYLFGRDLILYKIQAESHERRCIDY
jgi:hypothetical protein